MPHSTLAEIAKARLKNRLNHYDRIYSQLNDLCVDLTDMTLQEFHACHDQLSNELESLES